MASKVSLLFLILTTVSLLVLSYFLLQKENREGFQVQQYSVQNLDINTCPPFAVEIQTAKGYTDCCQGDMVDGKCNGTTFCTKSPAHDDIKTCQEAWREYFSKKGADFCPPTMPNYYEDVVNTSGPKGCSAGPITEDGKQPKDTTSKQCKVYPSEEDNKAKLDSCFAEKERAKVQCPAVNGTSPSAAFYKDWRDQSKYLAITCDYPFEIGMPTQCFDKKSVELALDTLYPNWRNDTYQVDWVKLNSCDNYISRRESSRQEANKLQAEQKAREDAQAKAKAAADARAAAEAEAKKRADEASRLQQQLDEANRQLRNCKP
jgi:hypothetical protein